MSEINLSVTKATFSVENVPLRWYGDLCRHLHFLFKCNPNYESNKANPCLYRVWFTINSPNTMALRRFITKFRKERGI